MYLRTETIAEKKLVGKQLTMRFAEDKTVALWQSFMPRRREIQNNLNQDLISLQLFGPDFNFEKFDPQMPFVKWAAVEVPDFSTVPEGMETLILPAGLYAVFLHRGAAATAPQTFQYIFGTWLPASEFELDNRPQFEVLGAKYQNNSPASEEEIWIPVKPKNAIVSARKSLDA